MCLQESFIFFSMLIFFIPFCIFYPYALRISQHLVVLGEYLFLHQLFINQMITVFISRLKYARFICPLSRISKFQVGILCTSIRVHTHQISDVIQQYITQLLTFVEVDTVIYQPGVDYISRGRRLK